MKPSLRARLLEGIRRYAEIRENLSPDFDRAKALAGDAGMASIIAELDAREAALNAIWQEARPQMNEVEARRYVTQIGYAPAYVFPGSVPEKLDPELAEALAKVRAVFPSARPYDPSVRREHKMEPVKRPEAPVAEPPRPRQQGEFNL